MCRSRYLLILIHSVETPMCGGQRCETICSRSGVLCGAIALCLAASGGACRPSGNMGTELVEPRVALQDTLPEPSVTLAADSSAPPCPGHVLPTETWRRLLAANASFSISLPHSYDSLPRGPQ